jgi:hypothetical protein
LHAVLGWEEFGSRLVRGIPRGDKQDNIQAEPGPSGFGYDEMASMDGIKGTAVET